MKAPLLIGLVALAACSPREPPHWPEGGARLAMGTARWTRPGDEPIELRRDGRVFEGGDLLFVIDRVGRIVDRDYEPLAILLPDGQLVDVDAQGLGQIGLANAAPPWTEAAWLSVTADGHVIHFDPDGDRESLGNFEGCAGAVHRTCTVVAHMVQLRQVRTNPSGHVRVGVGVGIGF
ncbi:MAG TPA: hypothetical protein VFQ61_12725 [Polyangiaceae bacterium]|nr:hypothetical protein [Polyangiaceae bacterium]